MPALIPIARAIHLLVNAIDIRTRVRIRTARALDIDIFNRDIRAYGGARAHQVPDVGVVLFARCAAEVADGDVGDVEVRGEL